MIAQLGTLEQALRDAGFQANLSFGRSIASDLTKSNIGLGRVVLQFPTLDTEAETMVWQGSPLVSLRGTITAFARTDLDTVALLHLALQTLGFQRENGDVGRPPRMPIGLNLGAVVVVWINCPGGVRGTAEAAGDIWAASQGLELAFYTP
jgi:hypothetical protein